MSNEFNINRELRQSVLLVKRKFIRHSARRFIGRSETPDR